MSWLWLKSKAAAATAASSYGGGEQTITWERTNAEEQKSRFSNQEFIKRGIPRVARGKIDAAL
jgi:hypothetical protein